MSAEELEEYQFQLDQIQAGLSKDPTNEELKTIEQGLKELIELTKQAAAPARHKKASEARSNTPTTPTIETSSVKSSDFSVGQDVKARWKDGEYYRATIKTIGGADQIFSVVFRGYKETELVKREDIELLEKDKIKRKGVFEDVPKKKSKSAESKTAAPNPIKKKTSKAEENKNAWLNFANSKSKKATAVRSKKESIFKTPDNPQSKVGVVGSGRGMTSYQSRGKHTYSGVEEQKEED